MKMIKKDQNEIPTQTPTQSIDEETPLRLTFYSELKDKVYGVMLMYILQNLKGEDTETWKLKDWIINNVIEALNIAYPIFIESLTDDKLKSSINKEFTYESVLCSIYNDFPDILNPTNKDEAHILDETYHILLDKQIIQNEDC